MRVAAFDLSSNTGWAVWDGVAPIPTLGKKRVLHWDRDEGLMIEEFRKWFGRFIAEHQPDVIAVEHPAMSNTHTDVPTIYRQAMIRGVILWGSHLLQKPRYSIPAASWRKTFIGFGTRRTPKGTPSTNWKRLARERCKVLGWDDLNDHNVAEASGVLDHVVTAELKIAAPWRSVPGGFLPLPENFCV
jgi:hypothetical protein